MLFNKRHKKLNLSLGADKHLCLSGADIFKNIELMDKESQYYLQNFRHQVSCSERIYENTYLHTLYKLAEFCQSMPDREGNPYYSLLKKQLNLSYAILKLRKGLLLPLNAKAETIVKEESRWTYACFSAGLLYKLSRLVYDRKVIFYNLKQEEEGAWQVFAGSLFRKDRLFKVIYHQNKDGDNENCCNNCISDESLMSVIITQIISPSILLWLSQNTELFSVWWKTLHFQGSDNIISELIQKAIKITGFVEKKHLFNKAQKNYEDYQENNYDSLETLKQLLNYVYQVKDSHSENTHTIHYLRIAEGLFITQDTLQNFLLNQKTIQENVIKENEHDIYVRFCPVNFDDRRSLTGILIKKEVLDKKWLEHEIQENFQREIKL